MALSPVYSNVFFEAVPCRDCDLPGYLILLPRAPSSTFDGLSREARAVFGETLAILETAIVSATRCDRVYVLRFSEGLASVHFHLFPRTPILGQQFREETNFYEPNLNGEMLFAWARKRFKVEAPTSLSEEVINLADSIRLALRKRR